MKDCGILCGAGLHSSFAVGYSDEEMSFSSAVRSYGRRPRYISMFTSLLPVGFGCHPRDESWARVYIHYVCIHYVYSLCMITMYIPNSIKVALAIAHFRYIKIHTWLRGLGE